MAPSEFRNVFRNGKTRMMGLPYAEKRMMIVSRVDTITERDRQTDGRTTLLYQYRAAALLC